MGCNITPNIHWPIPAAAGNLVWRFAAFNYAWRPDLWPRTCHRKSTFLITVHNGSATWPVLNEVIKTLGHKSAPELLTARRYKTFTAHTRSKVNEYHPLSYTCSYLCTSLHAWENFMLLGDVFGQVASTVM